MTSRTFFRLDALRVIQQAASKQLQFNYNMTMIRRYHEEFDYNGSDRNYDMRSIRLQYNYDTTTTKKTDTFIFACVEWKQARATRRSLIVVVS